MGTGLVAVLLTLGLGANPPDVWTMRSRSLEIPIRVNEAKRADLQDLELHVSIDQGRTWTLAGKANPDQKKFIYQAQSDGLYWFAVCAIDHSGKREPPDLMSKPADLKVLIDTIHPPLQIVAADRVGEEIQVAWECSDSAADPMSLRLDYRAADQGPSAPWTPVTPINQVLSGQS